MVVLGVCLGSLQLARVRVPAVLSGDDEREGRREGPVRERQLSGSEAGGNFANGGLQSLDWTGGLDWWTH